MNKYQKVSTYTSIIIVILSFLAWAFSGFEIFTKTSRIVEKKDELFDTTYKVVENYFIWGLDLTLLISGISLLISGILYFIFRKKSI